MPSKNVKKRNWCFILYPESAPADWVERLSNCGVPCAVSPLHEFDVNPDGEIKKPHYHVILCYPGPTTFSSVKKFVSSLNCPIPEPLEAVRGYYRYFTHKDNPEKYQYSEVDIRCFNGFSIRDYVELTKTEVLRIKSELQQLIRSLNIIEYSDFMDYLQDNQLTDFYDVASCNTYFFEKYISSRRNAQKK